MSVQIVTDNNREMMENMSMDKLDKCSRCGNAYLLVLLKEGKKYSDFGDRHCPFCGVHTEAFCVPVNE